MQETIESSNMMDWTEDLNREPLIIQPGIATSTNTSGDFILIRNNNTGEVRLAAKIYAHQTEPQDQDDSYREGTYHWDKLLKDVQNQLSLHQDAGLIGDEYDVEFWISSDTVQPGSLNPDEANAIEKICTDDAFLTGGNNFYSYFTYTEQDY
jgi:hypothetical protein